MILDPIRVRPRWSNMKIPEFEYSEPKSIKKASQILRERGEKAYAMAGGTDLIPALKKRLKVPEVIVDLTTIPHLDRITYSGTAGLILGALVSLRQLAAHPLVREEYPALAQAAGEVGTAQLQAMGTVGGNLCQNSLCFYYSGSLMEACFKRGGEVCHAVPRSKGCWASYCGDLAPALLVLGAKVKIVDLSGEKVIPLRTLYSGDGKKPNKLKPGQILTEIQVPPPAPYSGSAYLKLRMRKAIDYPLLGVATCLTMAMEGKVCKEVVLGLTAVERAPLLIVESGKIKGKPLTHDVVEALAQSAYQQAHPLNNLCELTPQYRKEMVKVYVASALPQALQHALERGGPV